MEQLIDIQQDYIDAVNLGIARWSHCRKHYQGDLGGHANRIVHGAHRRAVQRLGRLGFNETQVRQIIADARDMAGLIRLAGSED
jgi:hypothetical protein